MWEAVVIGQRPTVLIMKDRMAGWKPENPGSVSGMRPGFLSSHSQDTKRMKIHKHHIFTAGLLALASVAAAQPTYTAVRMPTAYPNGFDNLKWISDDGKVAAGATDSYADDHTRTQPCVQYKDGAFTVLPTPNFNCT